MEDFDRIERGDVGAARKECLDRLQHEMERALREHGFGSSISDVLQLKKLMHK